MYVCISSFVTPLQLTGEQTLDIFLHSEKYIAYISERDLGHLWGFPSVKNSRIFVKNI